MRQSFLLLRDMLARGGLTADCAGPAGGGRIRLTLQPDGTTFLRCTVLLGPVLDVTVSVMADMAARIEAAFATVAATRALLDVIVLGTTMSLAAVAMLSAGWGWAELWRPALVFAAYAALVPLRRPLLRLLLRLVLRLAFADGRTG